mgnify:CR=1 FL=1
MTLKHLFVGWHHWTAFIPIVQCAVAQERDSIHRSDELPTNTQLRMLLLNRWIYVGGINLRATVMNSVTFKCALALPGHQYNYRLASVMWFTIFKHTCEFKTSGFTYEPPKLIVWHLSARLHLWATSIIGLALVRLFAICNHHCGFKTFICWLALLNHLNSYSAIRSCSRTGFYPPFPRRPTNTK